MGDTITGEYRRSFVGFLWARLVVAMVVMVVAMVVMGGGWCSKRDQIEADDKSRHHIEFGAASLSSLVPH